VNRALRAATVGVLFLSPVALSACSAGQVTQTATQERDKAGAMAQVGDITVRAAEFESPRGGAYESGDDAKLRMAIVNGGREPDTLVRIDGEGFGGVEIQSAGTGTSASAATGTSAAPTAEVVPTTAGAVPTTAGAVPTTAGAVPTTAGAVPTTAGGNAGSDQIEIPADTTVFVDGDAATITLTDLDEALTVGQYLKLTLIFEKAGEVTLPVTVANPDKALERGKAFDFHPEEGTEETARQRESAGE
jgi:copper(I)-binding protein